MNTKIKPTEITAEFFCRYYNKCIDGCIYWKVADDVDTDNLWQRFSLSGEKVLDKLNKLGTIQELDIPNSDFIDHCDLIPNVFFVIHETKKGQFVTFTIQKDQGCVAKPPFSSYDAKVTLIKVSLDEMWNEMNPVANPTPKLGENPNIGVTGSFMVFRYDPATDSMKQTNS